MEKAFRITTIAVIGAVILFVTMATLAQDRPRFDPERIMQMIMDRMQEQMQATDEEWKIIQPLIQNVFELQRETRMIGMGRGFFGPPPGREGGPGNRPRRFGPEPMQEVTALQEAIDNENASADDIQAKLTALRKARDAKEKELEEAREKLRKVLTLRQEAILVLMGTLN
ncbi:hypothetical protein GF373_10745 [bacterium]|nr:hypothetical protein [bacterium]